MFRSIVDSGEIWVARHAGEGNSVEMGALYWGIWAHEIAGKMETMWGRDKMTALYRPSSRHLRAEPS